MTSETGSRRPIDAPNDRTMRDSLQQPVKGAPVDAPLHEETADAAVAGPAGTAQSGEPVPGRPPAGSVPPRAASATNETAYGESAYAEPAYRDPAYRDPAYRDPAYRDPAYQEPAYQEPAYQEEPVRRNEPTRTATISSPGRIGFGAGVLVLGILLGMSDQQADGAGMSLRVPALIAALIMVAQGIQLIMRGLPRQTEVEMVEVVDDTDPAHPRTAVRPRPWAAGMSAFRTDPGSMGLPTLVIVLAIWLGLATLRIDDAPANLSNLSMLSAFVLFALGWTLIPARA